jgi:hypothetical protein
VIKVANPPEPRQGPRLALRPSLADPDKISALPF